MNCDMKECYLDLASILKSEDFSENFRYNLDLSELDERFQNVIVDGAVKNTAGAITMKMKIEGEYVAECDRCLDNVVLHLESVIDTIVTGDCSKDDSVTLIAGKADLVKTAYDALSLELPLIVHCSENCKGLCQGCGVNLNKGQCKCEQID